MSSSITPAGRGAAGSKQSFAVLNQYKTRVLVDGAGRTQVIFHQTPVVTFNADRIQLNTGGWWTSSTKSRMNQASQEFGLGFRVFQKQGNWFADFEGAVLPFDSDRLELQCSSVRKGTA